MYIYIDIYVNTYIYCPTEASTLGGGCRPPDPPPHSGASRPPTGDLGGATQTEAGALALSCLPLRGIGKPPKPSDGEFPDGLMMMGVS